jgi:predicted small lipoprotein YifL
MSWLARSTLRTATLALIATAASGCGQRGPLTLPDEARPIERLPQPTTTPATPQDDEDERQNER